MELLRSGLFYLVFIPGLVVHSLLSLVVAAPLPFRPRFHFVTLLNRWVLFWLRWICGVRIQVQGLEHLPREGAFVIVANHQSALETFFLQTLIGPQATVLKKELLRLPFFGWALALLRPIAIDRQKRSGAVKQLLRQGRQRLESGLPVLVFPQGTRVMPGARGRFNKGGAMLACASGVPLLPVVHNAGDCWPSGHFSKHAGIVRVEIGPLIDTSNTEVNEVHERLVAWMNQRLEAQGATSTASGVTEAG